MGNSLRNPFRVEDLPLLGRLHRRAFRAGYAQGHRLTRLAAKSAFYALHGCRRKPAWGTLSVGFGDERRTAKFDARNHQFSALYFDKYQHGAEPAVSGILETLLPNGGVFYDVGANWGYHSIAVASRPGFCGQVHAFEPLPSTFADLQDLVRQLKLTRVVACHPMAIGQCDEQGFLECGSHSGLAHLSTAGKGVPVQIRALDTLGLPPPDVMKVDTEGHEEHVFRGAERLLKKHRPLIVFEHRFRMNLPNGRWHVVLELLESYGYQLYLPAWRSTDATSVFDRAAFRHPAMVSEGLQLCACTSRTRFDYPGFPDLLACHRDRISWLKNVSQVALRQAA